MKRMALLLCMLGIMLAWGHTQEVYTTENIPKVHLQDARRYACNPAGILSTAACDSIDRMLYALEQQTGIETVVAVLPSIGQEECFDFAHRLFNSWGVGKKGKDNGLVILLVTDQRCIQFVTGYGLEGILPDAICKRIQTQAMIPYLRDNRWDEGMVAGVRAVCARLDGSMENDTAAEEDESLWIALCMFLGFIAVGCVIVWLAVRSANKCPNCGKHELQRTASQLVYRRGGVKAEDVTYVCRSCGHVVTRRQNSYDENYRGGSGAGPVIFGGRGFGGGFGGGGFSGGSFGGGMSGGGGAGSRF
ncbi:MAG: TPM domain-containing protein [Bacteroides sp.]|nr:TPM domain-containing protein [Bacteroides sp.]